MTRKPIFDYHDAKRITISVENVFKANFNDTYFIESFTIELDELDRENLVWFDPYKGYSKIGNTHIAIAYCSDEEMLILVKCGDEIKEERAKRAHYCIVSEDNNEHTLLAAHISFN